MKCPSCHSDQYILSNPCPDCGFQGDGRSLERLSNLEFLLSELESWQNVSAIALNFHRERYHKQRRQIEVALGLRQPPPDEAEAQALRFEIAKQKALSQEIIFWKNDGWLESAVYQTLSTEINEEINRRQERLLDAPSSSKPLSPFKKIFQNLEHAYLARETIGKLRESGQISPTGYKVITSSLGQDIERLEILAGLRERPQPRPVVQPEPVSPEEKVETKIKTPKPERPPRQPWTWDRVWESLLSERTLKAILFLGAMLLFAGGVSWVAWNWDTFPPLVQVAFLGGFTAAFYLLGWYVRVKMALPDSGIALSAVASLLVPLDFFAFYISGGFPPGSWPQIWLIASVVCLGIYLVVAFTLQAEFFGYLVAIAAGSLVTAVLNIFNVQIYWWQMGLAFVALALALIGQFYRRREGFLFSRPFAHTAGGIITPIMIIGLGWGVLVGIARTDFHFALAVDWWIGGLILLLMAGRYRMRLLALASALTFPVAVWLTYRLFFLLWGTPEVWFALGWALLVPAYLWVGWWLVRGDRGEDEIYRDFSRTAVYMAVLLTIVSAIWSLTNIAVAGWTHWVLAATMVLAVYLWQEPRWLWLMSLFLTSGLAAWQGGRGAGLAELTLPWGLLSVLHVIAALRIRNHTFSKGLGSFTANPVFGASLLIAGTALLPPLILWDRPLLLYALTNWIGINGWLVYLDQKQDVPGLQQMLSHPRLRNRGRLMLHWFTAVPVIAWLWLAWSNGRPLTAPLGLIYAALAWGMLWISVRARRWGWRYRVPWQTAAHASNICALYLVLAHFDQPWMVAAFWLMAGFYFTAAWVFHWRHWLLVAGMLLPFAWLVGLDYLGLPDLYLNPALAFLVLAYMLAAVALRRWISLHRLYQESLFAVAILTGLVAFFWSLGAVASWWSDDQLFIVAFTPLLLAVSFAIYSWQVDLSGWATIAIWLLTFAGGLVVKRFSHGTGRSAVLVALLAIFYILTERRLFELALAKQAHFYRKAWRLFRRPLLLTGWLVSVGAIGAALVRNMLILGGGTGRETYAIIALLFVVGLYALSAYLFRQARFVWFASFLLFAPWTLLADLIWKPGWEWYGLSWLLLALTLAGTGIWLAYRLGLGKWSWPPQVVAHSLVPLALFWSANDTAVSSWSFALAILFYLAAVWVDRHFRLKESPANPRFLYPAAGLVPVWALFFLVFLFPSAPLTTQGLLILAFALPALVLGRRLARWEPEYRWPLYLVAYGTAVIAMLFVAEARPFLIWVLLFNTGLAFLSVWLFREPVWWYPATLTLPWAVWLVMLQADVEDAYYFGWMLIGTGAIYFLGAYWLREYKLRRYATPLLIMMFVMVGFGLLLSSFDRFGALVGYSLAAIILGSTAVWLGQPILFHVVVRLAAVAYWMALWLWELDMEYLGLALWPGIAVLFLTGWLLDRYWGIKPREDGAKYPPFPWGNLREWSGATVQRLLRWWALPFYISTFTSVALSALLPVESEWRWFLVLSLGTAVYTWALFRFRLRPWLLLAWSWAQFSWWALIRWIGWTDDPAQSALAFFPATLLTAFMGILVERLREERPPDLGKALFQGWSRPFYLLLAINLFIGQNLAFVSSGYSPLVTALNGLLVAGLATLWQKRQLAYIPLITWLVALGQYNSWIDGPFTDFPVWLALLALIYGMAGYGLRYYRRVMGNDVAWQGVWERPLIQGGWFTSAISLLLVVGMSGELFPALIRSLFGPVQLLSFERPYAQMTILVFAILGLFFLTAAVVERKRTIGYAALALLLGSWSQWLLLIQEIREVQLYAIPAGIYLLGIGWLEWKWGSQAVARWVDRAALLLIFGSAFWQSFGELGGIYALLMVMEGLLIGWLGSTRRLRRFLYSGVTAVIIAVVGQLIEPLLALNTLVLLLLGGVLVALGVALERRIETVRELSVELRAKLENWE